MPVPAGSTPPAPPLVGPIAYDPVLSRVRLTIPLDAFPTLNANPFFETDAANWFTLTGTFVRSTAQAHEGVASGLLTPDGVSAVVAVGSEQVAATAGVPYRVRAWVRCAVARNVVIGLNFYNAGSVFFAGAETSVAVAANTWTLLDFQTTAPPAAAFAQHKIAMSGTPPVGHTLHVDEARLSLGTPDVVHIQRSPDALTWTTVRGGLEVPVVAGVAALDDYEFTPGVANDYRVRLRTVLNANPFLETDAANWFTLTGTFVRSTAQAHEGAASGLLTPSGTHAEVSAGTEQVPTTPGARHFMRAWVRCAVARDIRFGFNWYDAGAALIGSAETALFVAANTWTLLTFHAYAPPHTAFVQEKFEMPGTPPPSHLLYVDEARLTGPAETTLYTGSILVNLDGVWLKSLDDPALNRKVRVRDWSPIRRPSRTGVFDVLNAEKPIAVGHVRSSRRWNLDVWADTPAEATAINALLDDGGVLLVHVPADSTVPAGYVTVADTEEAHPPYDVPKIRTITLPMTVARTPPPEVVGVSVP